jgi:hypothetical protein
VLHGKGLQVASSDLLSGAVDGRPGEAHAETCHQDDGVLDRSIGVRVLQDDIEVEVQQRNRAAQLVDLLVGQFAVGQGRRDQSVEKGAMRSLYLLCGEAEFRCDGG